MSNAGAFYADIARGLGTRLGLSAAYVAVFCYTALLIGICGVFSYFAESIFNSEFGIDLPWQLYAGVLVGAVAVLAFRRVDFNARLLSVIFTVEILLALVLDVAILASEGFSAFTLDAFNPSTRLQRCCPALRSRLPSQRSLASRRRRSSPRTTEDPKKTVPRATYLAVLVVGIFLPRSAPGRLSPAFGADDAAAVAAEDPGVFVFDRD